MHGEPTMRSAEAVSRPGDGAGATRPRGAPARRPRCDGGGWGNELDLVFTREDGSPIHPQAFSEAFERHPVAAKLPKLSLHGLRRTHATIALRAGVHPKVVSERLGPCLGRVHARHLHGCAAGDAGSRRFAGRRARPRLTVCNPFAVGLTAPLAGSPIRLEIEAAGRDSNPNFLIQSPAAAVQAVSPRPQRAMVEPIPVELSPLRPVGFAEFVRRSVRKPRRYG